MRRVALLICALLVCNFAPALSADSNPSAIIALHRSFTGWQFGDPGVRSVVLEGARGDDHFVLQRRGPAYRNTLVLAKSGLQVDRGFTGSIYWSSNENGFTIPAVGDAVKANTSENVILSEGLELFPVTGRGNSKIEGAAITIVRVTPPGGFPIDAYIDQTSGALKRAVIDPDGDSETLDILRYAQIDGKRFIASWRFTGGETYDAAQVQVNAAVNDEQLHPPAARAHWNFGAGEPIAINTNRDSVEVSAMVNGVAGRFLLDSGASGIYLTSDFAQRAHLKDVAPTTSYGVSEHAVEGSTALADTITVGSSTLHNVYVSTGQKWENIDGLLGFDFLAGALVNVDLKAKTLRVNDPSGGGGTPLNAMVINADLSSGTPNIPVTINGSVTTNLTFDTGDPMEVILNDTLYAGHKVDINVEFYARIGGIGGTSGESSPCGRARSIELGALHYDNVPVCFQKGFDAYGDGGIVGFDLLKHFNWTFDYQRSRMILTQNGM